MASKISNEPKVVRHVKWLKPDEGWCTFNTDEVVHDACKTGCKGIIRHNVGVWLKGFAKPLGKFTVTVAELWGIWERIKVVRYGLQ